jgi:hypothetical protein
LHGVDGRSEAGTEEGGGGVEVGDRERQPPEPRRAVAGRLGRADHLEDRRTHSEEGLDDSGRRPA